MNVIVTLFVFVIAGCASFEPAYNDVYRYQTSRDSKRCVESARLYLAKSFSDDQKSELYGLMGVCYSQIGYYDEAKSSYDASINIATAASPKARAFFQRGLLSFTIAASDTVNNEKHIKNGCADMAEACRLMPDKYCSEYNIKQQPPTNCQQVVAQ